MNSLDFVTSKHYFFDPYFFQGHHLLITTFEIPFNGFKLSSLFVNLEQNKEVLGILEYSVSQTTLDQVCFNFIKF